MRATVIGLGSNGAGDDAVARMVIRELRLVGTQWDVELVELDNPSDLCWWLETTIPVILVDAVVNGIEPGRVLHLTADSVTLERLRLFSTHGIEVGQAIELARILLQERFTPDLKLIGITISEFSTQRCELSPMVAAAVAQAAAEVRALVGV
jgi:hydrogenase maturation protease